MTRLPPFSDQRRGLFVSIDGPSGAGKSTILAHLAQLLIADGEQVHTTAEKSRPGPRPGVPVVGFGHPEPAVGQENAWER